MNRNTTVLIMEELRDLLTLPQIASLGVAISAKNVNRRTPGMGALMGINQNVPAVAGLVLNEGALTDEAKAAITLLVEMYS